MKSTLGTGTLSWVSDSLHCRALLFNAMQSSARPKQELPKESPGTQHLHTTATVGSEHHLCLRPGLRSMGPTASFYLRKTAQREWDIWRRAARENRAQLSLCCFGVCLADRRCGNSYH